LLTSADLGPAIDSLLERTLVIDSVPTLPEARAPQGTTGPTVTYDPGLDDSDGADPDDCAQCDCGPDVTCQKYCSDLGCPVIPIPPLGPAEPP
jgi:hypothetical protein